MVRDAEVCDVEQAVEEVAGALIGDAQGSGGDMDEARVEEVDKEVVAGERIEL